MEKFKIEYYEAIGHSITKLYEVVAAKMGEDWLADNIRFDCTKINVAKNIYAAMEEAAVGKFGQQHGEENTKNQFAMMWCCSGPKAMDYFSDDEVEVFEGFVTYEENGDEEEL